MKNKNTNVLVRLKNLISDMSDDKIKYIVHKNVYKYAKSVIKRFLFSNKKDILIPYELFMVVLYDTNLAYLNNRKYLKGASQAYIKYTINEIITGQINSLSNRTVLDFQKDNDSIIFRIEPPLETDFWFNFSADCFEPTNSLKLLCSYFGHTNWYQQFICYEKDKKYFNYYQESYIKIEKSKRKFENFVFEVEHSMDLINEQNQETFFNIWLDRLKDDEKDFFIKYIKTMIISKEDSISLTCNDIYNEEKLGSLVKVFDTSSFDYIGTNTISYIKVIPSYERNDDGKFIIYINNSLYNKTSYTN